MNIDIFRAGSGDCLLITSTDRTTRILADAGLPDAYSNHIAAPLSQLRKKDQALDVLYVSHIDQDHIGGVVGILDAEVAWQVYDRMRENDQPWKKPTFPRPPKIKQIWHNAFLETISASKAKPIDSAELTASLTADASTLAATFALTGDRASLDAAEAMQMLALSVGEAIAVNWRIGKDQLDIKLNPAFQGGLMIWQKDAEPIDVGPFKATVLGPTPTELKLLRDKDWRSYINSKKGKERIANLKKRHKQDVDNLTSISSGNIAFAGNEEVTPPNVASLVILLEEGKKRVLLTGDADNVDMERQFRKAGLTNDQGLFEVDVLKVPHHGAHNSYSDEFAAMVRARHLVFCGDGEHGNPEDDVVEGYIKACRDNPPNNGEEVRFWFNCSEALAEKKHQAKWRKLAKRMSAANIPPWLKSTFLTSGPSMRLRL